MVDLIVSGVAAMISVMFNTAVELLAPLLGFDMELFNNTFPFAATAYTIFQSVAIGITLLIASVQIIPFFMQNQQSKTSPIRIGLSVIFAVAGIYFGNYILEGIIDIAQMPYLALTNADAYDFGMVKFDLVGSAIADICYTTSILLYIIILLLIGIAFIKLLLEAVERYVILFVLLYLSPLASSTLASEQTSGVAKRFLSMFISQCILMILNIWSLKMVVSVFSSLMSNPQKVLALMCCYAFLRIAAKLDSYLNQLGLNAAITGAGLGGELMATGMMIASGFGALAGGGKGFPGADGKKGTGGILGLSQKVSGAVGKINPLSGAADAGKNAIGAVAKTVGGGIKTGVEAAASTPGNMRGKFAAGMKAAGSNMKENIKGNMHKGWMKTQDSSLLARGIGQKLSPNVAGAIDTMKEGAGPLSAAQHQDLAENSFAASRAFNSFQGDEAVTEASDVAAVMQGTGLGNADPDAMDAINVGYGAMEAENTNFVLDASGAHASFVRDGKMENWEVLNSTQFSALSPEAQSSFTKYKDGNGNSYYYRHTTSRMPSEAQQQQQAFAARVAAFGADPRTNPLSGSDYSEMKRNQGAVNQVFSGLAASGASVGGSMDDNRQIAGVVGAMQIPNMPAAMKTQLNTSLQSGDPSVSANMNGNGVRVDWSDGSGDHNLSVISPSGAANQDLAKLQGYGFRAFDVGGETYYGLYQPPQSIAVSQFAAEPASYPLTPQVYSAISRNPEQVNEIFSGLSQSGNSLQYSEESRNQFASFMESTRFSGMNLSEKQTLVQNMRGDEAIIEGNWNGNGYQVSWEQAESFNRFTVLTTEGVKKNGFDENNLAAKGYVHMNNGGTDYWSRYEKYPKSTGGTNKKHTFDQDHI